MVTTLLTAHIRGGNLFDTLYSQCAEYSILTEFIPPGCDTDDRHEQMCYADSSLVGARINHSLDTNPTFDNSLNFPVDCEAGKVVSPYHLQNPIAAPYNFLLPFQNTIDYKVRRFFCLTHEPCTHLMNSIAIVFLMQDRTYLLQPFPIT